MAGVCLGEVAPSTWLRRPPAEDQVRFRLPLDDPALFPLGDPSSSRPNRPQVRTTPNAKDARGHGALDRGGGGTRRPGLVSVHEQERLESKDGPAIHGRLRGEMIDGGADPWSALPRICARWNSKKASSFYSLGQLIGQKSWWPRSRPADGLRALPRRARSDAGTGLQNARGDPRGVPRPPPLNQSCPRSLTTAGRRANDVAPRSIEQKKPSCDLARLKDARHRAVVHALPGCQEGNAIPTASPSPQPFGTELCTRRGRSAGLGIASCSQPLDEFR